jgi:hypothetical protein
LGAGIWTHVNLDGFFPGLRQQLRVVKNANRERDLFTAGDFSVFDYIEPDEPRISQIVADLLRPNGKHGQGATFLRQFLKIVRVPILGALA